MKKTRIIKINIYFIIIVVFIFALIAGKLVWIGLHNVKVRDIALSEFAKSRDTRKKILTARRGTIYSRSGEILAKDVNSYTVIAYLDPSRTKDINRPYHVINKEETAKKLSPLINMTDKYILSLLNTKIKSCNETKTECKEITPYQVELGPGGRGISELIKDKIEELDLPGIDFISSTKRYYPNGDFLSYTLGYAKTKDNEFVGEMGLEQYYNDELTGENGYIEYQSDLYGYQITSTPSVETKSIPGNDIYLTIDNNIQMFTEQAINKMEEGEPEWATIVVANAKTGEILGIASSPSFNNNELNIKSYYDPFISYEYEPGSTMKIFSFMASIDDGIYKGNDKYKSGSIVVDDAKIKDHNNVGWGTITYDQGFMASSNVAATNLALKLGRAKLLDYYNSLGFGIKTGITLPNEATGIVNFRYNTELASASFGQGITINASQMIQALTIFGNKGVMLKPYIVSKIVDSDGNVILENKRTEIRKVTSEQTINKMIELMRGVVRGDAPMATGTGYEVKGYNVIGKTGTAQIASSKGGYLTGKKNYTRSFAGLFPEEDPEIIVYAVSSKVASSSQIKSAVKNLIKDVGTYLNINTEKSNDNFDTFRVNIYINKDVDIVSEELKKHDMTPIVIGNGNKIINQFPKENSIMNLNNKIFLLTNDDKYKMPNIKGWSRSEITTFANMINLDVNFTGYGYASEFNIEKGTVIDKDMTLEVVLDSNFKIDD